MSDHSPLSVSFNIDIESVESDDGLHVNDAKLMWSNATNFDIERYKQILDNELIKCTLPVDALYCKDTCCNRHGVMLQTFHDKLINACLLAGNCIPTKSKTKSSTKCIPGWNEHVVPFKEQAILWHNLWQDNGRPRYGHIADIRRSTRARYNKKA
jgi:hypothetical protein